jgi:hypothetical protein
MWPGGAAAEAKPVEAIAGEKRRRKAARPKNPVHAH